MDFKKLVALSRTRRVFDQSKPVGVDDLIDLVDTARLIPSGMNKQPLKYVVTADPEQCADIFPLLGWAGYLNEWDGPEDGERPTGYVVILQDKDVASKAFVDHGIACQTIMLGAAEKGFGGCIIATVKRRKLAELLGLDDRFDILLVLALGAPAEKVVIEPLPSSGKIEYWRTSDGTHHVPKRGLDELIVARYPKK
jgi:nitroreductase